MIYFVISLTFFPKTPCKFSNEPPASRNFISLRLHPTTPNHSQNKFATFFLFLHFFAEKKDFFSQKSYHSQKRIPMSKSTNHLLQFQNAQKGIELLFFISQKCHNYNELQSICDTLALYFFKNSKDKAPNKNLILFGNFLKNEQPKKREKETVKRKKVSKNVRKKNNYLDHLSEYEILRNRGYSYQKIADYSHTHFKAKVSRETIRNILIQGGTK